MKICTIEQCTNRNHARGLCQTHYNKTSFKRQSVVNYRLRNKDKLKDWKRVQDKRYRQRYPERIRQLNAKKRAQKTEGIKRYGRIPDESIDNYYSRKCGICDGHIEGKYEIDHIIPLSRNGVHTVDNLQLTHPVCNRVKRNRLQNEMMLDIIILKELIYG